LVGLPGGYRQGGDASVILVGHSRGGHVIGEVAERIPDQIACLVYVTAALSTPGQTMFETISAGQTQVMAAPMAATYQCRTISPKPACSSTANPN